jgi:hypothetical protein
MRLSADQLVRPTFDLRTGRAIWPTEPHTCGSSERGCVCDASCPPMRPTTSSARPDPKGSTLSSERTGQ